MSVSSTIEEPRIIKLVNGSQVTAKSNVATRSETIPKIDVSRMYSSKLSDRQAVAEEIREASRQIGFFLITEHVSEAVYIPSA